MPTILDRTIRVMRSEQMLVALLAVITGLAAGFGGIAFRHAIDLFQAVFFGSPTPHLASYAADLAWWHVLLAPAVGGLLIGAFRRWLVPGRRYQAVAEVIEAATLKGGRIRLRDGLVAAVGSAATLGMGGTILAEAALSFLGLGIRPPFPSWGSMLSDARETIAVAPWVSIFPGLAIFLTVLGLNLLGDGLRDIFDPQATTRRA